MQLHDAKHRYILGAGGRQPTGGLELPMYKVAHVISSESCANVQYGFQTLVSFWELEKDTVVQMNILKTHLPVLELFLSGLRL